MASASPISYKRRLQYTMFHYAYGSNLSPKFLTGYCPSARFVMKAYLPNFRVEFRFYSKMRQG